IALFHQLARDIGLVETIDARLGIFKIRLPYTESDHVLNIAFNALCNGQCLQDIELRRNDVNYLDALGAQRIPDPTTAGDFCRRFTVAHLNCLQDIFDEVRIGVWQHQPAGFFHEAILDADGTLVPTTGQCKRGMDIAYNGVWGYHAPFALTRGWHQGAVGVFQRVRLRGDTDFSQTEHLDRWDADGRISFIFGYDNKLNLVELAEQLPDRAWQTLQRPPRYQAVTGLRHRPVNVKDRIVRARGFETLRLNSEEVAEFNYGPHACQQEYRMIV